MNIQSAKLTVLISTLNEGILGLQKTIAIRHPQVCYLIIHQNLEQIPVPEFLKRDDIQIITSTSRGLSRSRNLGLKNCKTPYALIADDDVAYFKNSFDTIITSFEDNPELDLAMFKIKTPRGEKEYKNYPEHTHVLKEKSHPFSSIEMALRISSIRKNKIKFDRRFGLGAFVPRAEEAIFVMDCISINLLCMYFPYFIVEHPYESSGKNRSSGNKKYFDQGAVEERLKQFHFKNIRWKSYRASIVKNLIYISGAMFIKFTFFVK